MLVYFAEQLSCCLRYYFKVLLPVPWWLDTTITDSLQGVLPTRETNNTRLLSKDFLIRQDHTGPVTGLGRLGEGCQVGITVKTNKNLSNGPRRGVCMLVCVF